MLGINLTCLRSVWFLPSVRKIFFLQFLLCFFFSPFVPAQDFNSNKIYVQARVHVAPLFSFYQTDKDYSANAKTSVGFIAGAKAELVFNPSTSLLVGLDYLHHGLTFESYYFAPAYSRSFDKKFNAIHHLNINEFQIPVLLNFNIGVRNTELLNMLYVNAGWVFRYLMPTSTTITSKSDGKELWKGNTDLKMEYSLFTKKTGSMIQSTIGFQHIFPRNHQAMFCEITYQYGLSPFRYVGNEASFDLLISDSHVSMGLGYRF